MTAAPTQAEQLAHLMADEFSEFCIETARAHEAELARRITWDERCERTVAARAALISAILSKEA